MSEREDREKTTEEILEETFERPEGISDSEWEILKLKRENERLKREREEYRKTLPPKERLYDHVNVSVRTMDIFIGCMLVLLVIVLVMALANR